MPVAELGRGEGVRPVLALGEEVRPVLALAQAAGPVLALVPAGVAAASGGLTGPLRLPWPPRAASSPRMPPRRNPCALSVKRVHHHLS